MFFNSHLIWTGFFSIVFLFIYAVKLGPRGSLSCSLFRINCPDVAFGGTFHPRYSGVYKAFKENFYSGQELGAQLALYVDDKLVMDIWGTQGTNYSDRSLQVVYSSTKGVVGLVMAMAVDRGYFNFSDKVTKYWINFGKNGKENITIEHVLKHEAGLPSFDDPVGTEEYYDLEKMRELIERSHPWWPKDTPRCYHANTQGWIMNEIFRRRDPKGRTIGKFISEEISPKLGLEFYMGGFPQKFEDRLSPVLSWPRVHEYVNLAKFALSDPGFVPLMTDCLIDNNCCVNRARRSMSVGYSPEWWNTAGARAGEMPGSNGITNALSLAKIANLIVNGGQSQGVRLLSQSSLEMAMGNEDNKLDASGFLNNSMTSAGWYVFHNALEGWTGSGGLGGSLMIWNPEHKIGLGYAMTSGFTGRLGGDPRTLRIVQELQKLFPTYSNSSRTKTRRRSSTFASTSGRGIGQILAMHDSL